MTKIRVAIDGPGGAGKSTIAKALAETLNIEYVDTGAMYRALAYKLNRDGIDVDEVEKIAEILKVTEISLNNGNVILDGEVVNKAIRTPHISEMASKYSALPEVREKLVTLQREMGRKNSLVMDGRDIGTNVLPMAEHKFFITAEIEERARRRYIELLEKGENVVFETVEKEMEQRDYKDIHRSLNPLKKAEDALVVDTTCLSIQQVVDVLLREVQSNGDS